MNNQLPNKFSQGEVNRIFQHIPDRTLRFWANSGLVSWSKEHHDRRGLHREYCLQDLFLIGVVEELMDLGLSTKRVEKIVKLITMGKDPDIWEKTPCTLILPKHKILVKTFLKKTFEKRDVNWNEAKDKFKGLVEEEEEISCLIQSENLEESLKDFKTEILVIIMNLEAVAKKVRKYINSDYLKKQ